MLVSYLFSFSPPTHNAGGGDAWCMGILENITLIPRRDRGIIMPSVLQLQQTMQIVWIILNIIQVETVMNNSDYFNAAIQLFNIYQSMTHYVSYF